MLQVAVHHDADVVRCLLQAKNDGAAEAARVVLAMDAPHGDPRGYRDPLDLAHGVVGAVIDKEDLGALLTPSSVSVDVARRLASHHMV